MSPPQISDHPFFQPTNVSGERVNAVHDYLNSSRRSNDATRPRLRVVTSSTRYPHLPTPPLNDIGSAGSSPLGGRSALHRSRRNPQPQEVISRALSRSYLPSPPSSRIGSTKSSPISELSSKSVRFSHLEDHIRPGQYSAYSPKSPSKTVLKNRELKAADMPSLFAENTPVVAASSAMDTVLINLTTCIKNFKWPSELDFSANTASPMILANTEKNQAFIHQLRDLDRLWNELNQISTHGDEKLGDKHKATDVAIGKALQKMKEHQLKLYEKFTKAVESALTNIATDLDVWVKHFEYLSELDFRASSDKRTALPINERRKQLNHQLRKLSWFREALNDIPAHGDERLQDQRRIVDTGIERALQKAQDHQLKLYYRHRTKTYQSRRIARPYYHNDSVPKAICL
ncbi:unnamed protein product [Rhizoctonia solani]|uniref:Uncharacterized protein n=1 Tax=Rhizoctonia solani TaxID=456999 RepID=A0A8H3HAW9_9AGAM|nr:unnamed protein product [Rhizoctonia solani]